MVFISTNEGVSYVNRPYRSIIIRHGRWAAVRVVDYLGGDVMGEWQPIETAPRDGTTYLAINKNKHMVVCSWNTMEWTNAGHDPCVFPLADATHWIPLPTPPDTQ